MRRTPPVQSRAPVARALRSDARRLPRHAQRDGRRRRPAVAVGRPAHPHRRGGLGHRLLQPRRRQPAAERRVPGRPLRAQADALYRVRALSVGALACSLAPGGGCADRVPSAAGGRRHGADAHEPLDRRQPLPRARERARAIGLWGVSAGVGTGLGPIVGGSLTEWLGWRSVFAANAAAGVFALAIVLRVVPRSRSSRGPPHRRPGAAARRRLPGVAHLRADRGAALRLRHRRTSSSSLRSPSTMLVAFIVVELRVDEPLVDLAFFRDLSSRVPSSLRRGDLLRLRRVSSTSTRSSCRTSAATRRSRRGSSACRPPCRRYRRPALGLPRRNPRTARSARRRHAGAGVGVGSLALLAEQRGARLAAGRVHRVGFGYAVLSAPVSTVAVSSMPRDQAGVAAGIASSARNVGIVLGIAVLGAIVHDRVPVCSRPRAARRKRRSRPSGTHYVDALHIAYVVAARRGARRRARRGPDHAADASGASADALPGEIL